jgi:outer membrane protein assembly factor BamA
MIQRQTHPFFDEHADRKRAWTRAEWSLGTHLQTGAELARQSSTLAGEQVDASSVGVDVAVDTRVDPLMPRNAIYLRAGAERLNFGGSSAIRTSTDANGYIGLVRGSVLALRIVHEDFSRDAPGYYKAILGGSSNLRGFRAGYAIGDTLMTGSAEVRVPLTSPLRSAHFGLSAFVDAGTVYDDGQRFRDQKLSRGLGGGVWLTAPLVHVRLMVGRGIGASTRTHFAVGLTL